MTVAPDNDKRIDVAPDRADPDATDRNAGFEVLDDFERFNQKNDVFRRSWWDDEIRSDESALFYTTYRRPLENFRSSDGFTQKDYALRNAAWHVSDLLTELKENTEDRREGFCDAFTLQRDVAAKRTEFPSVTEAAREIKRVARGFGADLVGVTRNDERWLYTHKFADTSGTERPNDISTDLPYVVVGG